MHNNGDNIIRTNWPQSLYEQLHDAIDWSLPHPSTPGAGDARQAVLNFIRYRRAQSTPDVGYSREYVRHIREAAGEDEQAAARQRIEKALAGDLLMPYHRNAFAALGAETLQLGADVLQYRQIGARVWENRERWSEGLFGAAGSIAHLIRFLWPIDECEDEIFVPLFGWLLARWKPEWENARRWSERTLGTSSHNWFCHSFSGFYTMGVCFPEFKGWAQFQALVPDFIERPLRLLFEEEGWSREGSPGYHEFAASALQEMAHLAELNGVMLAPELKARLRKTAEAQWKMLAPDGDFPAFGDHAPMSLYETMTGVQRPDILPSTLLRRMAARFDLPEARFVAEAFTPRWQPPMGVLPDNGEDLLQRYQQLQSRQPSTLDTAMPRCGYYIMRGNWTPRADWIAIEAAEFGSRVTSHRHASLFNFELCARGRRILVDNWYGPVIEGHGAIAARMWRVGSSAHNVVTIDGADHVPIEGEYQYGASVTPIVDDWRSEREYSYFSGVHEGYRHLPAKVSAARRKLFYLRGDYWILVDRFTPDNAAPHQYTQHFHIDAPATMAQDGRVTTNNDDGNLMIIPVCGATDKQELKPCPHPVDNYRNPKNLQYSGSASGDHLIVTLLVPFEGKDAPQIEARVLEAQVDDRVLSPWEATALEIIFNGRRDVYFDQHLEWNLPWRVGEYSGAGRLFHSQCKIGTA